MRFLVVHDEVSSRIWQGDVLAAAIASSLRQIGHEAEIRTSTIGYESKDDHLVLVSNESSQCIDGKWPGPVHLFNLGEVYLNHEIWMARLLKLGRKWKHLHVDWIWDYSPNNRQHLESLGFPNWVYVPLGYHPLFEHSNLDESFDVGFLGKIADGSRREAAVSYVDEGLRTSIHTRQMKGKGYKKFVQGDWVRRETLCSKVYLHIHTRENGMNFPASRVIQLGLSNRRAVLSENSDWAPEGLLSPEHYLTFTPDCWGEMSEKIDWLLENEGERLRMAESGYQFVKNRWCLVDHLERALTEIGLS